MAMVRALADMLAAKIDEREQFRLLQSIELPVSHVLFGMEQVELLPYHVTAGAKYEMVGLSYQPEFDTAAAPNLNTELFRRFGLKCTHL